MRMGQRDGQGIGGICLQFTRDIEQHADHVLDLGLVGTAATDDRLLDFLRGVLGQRESAAHGRADRR